MSRDTLIDAAIGANENYRDSAQDDRDLELGFLYGTAEMVVMLTITDGESYHDLRESIAKQIDEAASKITYRVLAK
jgi:hypothetical protein